MFALAWLNRATSTNKPAYPSYHVQVRETEDRARHVDIIVPHPNIVHRYHSLYSAKDRHNRFRQEDLMIEKKIQTEKRTSNPISQNQFYTDLATLLFKNENNPSSAQHYSIQSADPYSSSFIDVVKGKLKTKNWVRPEEVVLSTKRTHINSQYVLVQIFDVSGFSLDDPFKIVLKIFSI